MIRRSTKKRERMGRIPASLCEIHQPPGEIIRISASDYCSTAYDPEIIAVEPAKRRRFGSTFTAFWMIATGFDFSTQRPRLKNLDFEYGSDDMHDRKSVTKRKTFDRQRLAIDSR